MVMGQAAERAMLAFLYSISGAAATVGVAMGAAGTDVALEAAAVALMADDLQRLAYALTLAQRNQRVVQQNLILSVLVIGVLVVGAIAGAFNNECVTPSG